MRTCQKLVLTAAAAALCFTATAQASPISYSYSDAAGSQIVHPNNPHTNGGIAFVGQSGVGNGGNTGALGNLLAAIPSNFLGNVGNFNNVSYTTGITITDSSAPGSPHTFSFNGLLNGTLNMSTNTLTNSWVGGNQQSFQIGANLYTVTINNLALPTLFSPGALTYNINAVPVAQTPEPSTLLLAGLGATCLGFFSWRRRTETPAAV